MTHYELIIESYGMPFAEHSYLYHFVRTDHRHNFSIYNTVLHLDSARSRTVGLEVESLAFIPQLTMAVLVIPMMLANKNLASTMLAQTLAFVTFNKVCTSQVSDNIPIQSPVVHELTAINSTFCGIWSSYLFTCHHRI